MAFSTSRMLWSTLELQRGSAGVSSTDDVAEAMPSILPGRANASTTKEFQLLARHASPVARSYGRRGQINDAGFKQPHQRIPTP
jgi:hypothetical protein